MPAIFRIILSSVSGVIVGSLLFGIGIGFLIFVLDKVDKSGGWIGTVQNPVLLALALGAVFGGVFGFFTGLIIGVFKITGLLKGAFAGFVVTEFLLIIVLAASSLIYFGHYSDFDRLSESVISSFISFLILTFCFLIPSVIIGAATVKLNNIVGSIFSRQTQ